MAVDKNSSVEDQLEFYKRRCEYYKGRAKQMSYELEETKREWDRFRTKWARRKKNYRDMQRALETERLKHNLLKQQVYLNEALIVASGPDKQAEVDFLANKLSKVHNFAKGL